MGAALFRRLLTPITPGAARSVVVLFVLMVALTTANLLFSSHEAGTDNRNWHQAVAADNAHWQQALTANNRKFCAVVTGFTAVPVPQPADPAADPSRERQYEWYQRFVRLGQDLGC